MTGVTRKQTRALASLIATDLGLTIPRLCGWKLVSWRPYARHLPPRVWLQVTPTAHDEQCIVRLSVDGKALYWQEVDLRRDSWTAVVDAAHVAYAGKARRRAA